MAGTIDITLYKDALVVLATAGVTVPILHRFNVNPVIGFMGAGMVAGPWGLGALAGILPGVEWITVGNRDAVAFLADLGVVFLLFLIGLELSFERLKSMRRLVLGLGGAQVLVSALVIGAIAGAAGLSMTAAIVVGMALALSSTAIVVDHLSRTGRMTAQTGRVSFAVLLFQDIAVVPILFIVGVLATREGGSLIAGFGLALIQAGIAILFIVLFGRFVLRRLFRLVAATGASEMFVAASLLVVVGTGVIAALAGMSMALGAFIAGLLLAETEYRRAIEATIEPFKGLLLGLFFFSVGMAVDIGGVIAAPGSALAAVVGLILVKGVIVLVLARALGVGRPAAFESAALLAGGGEFAFVVLQIAQSKGVIASGDAALALVAASVSMLAFPALAALGKRAARAATVETPAPETLEAPDPAAGPRAIVIGNGRVGRLVADSLAEHGLAHIVVDKRASAVVRDRRAGRPVYFGDPTQPAFLSVCGLSTATAVILTIDDPKAIDTIITGIRALRADVPIIARAKDADHARRLYREGVTDAVPETIEASLQLSEASLVTLGVPMGRVIASIHERRDGFRRTFAEAAAIGGTARPEPPRALKSARAALSRTAAEGGASPSERT